MSALTKRLNEHARVLAVCAAAAAAYLTIGLLRHNAWLAIGGSVIMLGYAALLVILSGRREPAALLAGRLADERHAQIMLRASAATAHLLVVVLVGGALVALATGSRYAEMLCALCAVGGLGFVVATIWYSRRS